MQRHRAVWSLWIAAGLLAAAGAFGPVTAQPDPGGEPDLRQGPDPRFDRRLSREVSLEVRSAALGDVVDRLASALKMDLETEPGATDPRISVYARKTTVFSLQQALAALFHTEWQRLGAGERARYRLLNSNPLDEQAGRLREQRHAGFLKRLLEMEQTVRLRNARTVVDEVRASLASRYPDLPEESLSAITPAYLRQTLILNPLRGALSRTLLRTGTAWTWFQNLPAHQQAALANFYVLRQLSGAPDARVTGPATAPRSGGQFYPEEIAQVLDAPQARVEYRLLYGDRWTGTLLMARIGASDNWATVLLPSSLFELPDYASLYPEAQARPGDRELRRNLNVRIDTATQSWDQALAVIAKAAGISVLTDSFPRPVVFRSPGADPVIVGTTVAETLDRVTEYYGYVWWRLGDFYLFRSRMWADEARAAVPDRLLQSLARSMVESGRLSPEDLEDIAALTDEQLLTLYFHGHAAGRVSLPEDRFDLDEIQLIRAGLTLLSQMTDDQRAAARGSGLPFSLMTPAQQFVMTSVAYDRGLPTDPFFQQWWRFQVSESYGDQRLATSRIAAGKLGLAFDFRQAGLLETELPLRATLVEK
jgi:hypothetical protein